MSYFTKVMGQITEATSTAKCPVCGKSSKQSIKKISQAKTMLCPYCKSLFVNQK